MSTLDGMSELDDSRPISQVGTRPQLEPLRRGETLVDSSIVLAWVLASDYLLYHSGGFAAWAMFLLVAASLLLVGKRSNWASGYVAVVLGLIAACSLRLAWCGSGGAVLSSIALIVALSMSINGTPPYLPDMVRYVLHALVGSGVRLNRFSLRGVRRVAMNPPARFGILLPLVVVAAFTSIFVMANPDVIHWMDQQIKLLFGHVSSWLQRLDGLQIACWVLSGWIGLGLIHPIAGYVFPDRHEKADQPIAPSESYIAVRNMMISVVVLFAAYLAFEFSTLWFREFPEGFYYAGYAHEGAFWLTVALGLATLILSLAFRGSIVQDARVQGLKRWAWIWSFENFLLGIAVLHRLFIYIDFNGMTRMRVIGLLGTLSVMIGFGLVVYKIVSSRGFLWLIRQQLWTVAIVAVLYTILPVDYLVHRYNAAVILSGNPAPSTQIPTHPTSAEGWIPLVALVDCDDETIREGIKATLANWLVKHEPANDWRDNQWSHQLLREKLQAHLSNLQPYLADPALRNSTMQEFYTYAYQWY